ncbi:hypothetical protein [Flavobacterium terrae]|uniref:Uncharacterized protein n=1 Tax=Flavobacterium terrae TaxID=415425 RepID=A0A1M6AUU5_9FLAO|nr:hypothetical protein [Flavobacterium terrae]SHI40245.1 hypothetical protein SAMN05444363_0415 [Flavobacterium terrae]
MKNFYIFLLLFFSFNLTFADSFIIKADGSKSQIKSNSFRVNSLEKMIYYKLIDSDKEIKLNFKDFDYVVFGVNKFKTFRLNNSREITGFFVLTETEDKMLITIPTVDPESDGKKVNYVFHVIDKNYNIIESHNFNNLKNQKSSNDRSEIYSKISFYFSECINLINRLSVYDKNTHSIDNLSILSFFNAPVYIECK